LPPLPAVSWFTRTHDLLLAADSRCANVLLPEGKKGAAAKRGQGEGNVMETICKTWGRVTRSWDLLLAADSCCAKVLLPEGEKGAAANGAG
jgi:hypothetical protein